MTVRLEGGSGPELLLGGITTKLELPAAAESRRSDPDAVGADAVGADAVGAVASWRLWVVPLAAGIFGGAAAFEVLPSALRTAGFLAVVWVTAGLAAFIAIHKGVDALGHQGASWASTLGMWLHSFLEGVVTATGYGVSVTLGVLLSVGLAAHLVPEATALVAVLRRTGTSSRQAVLRAAASGVLVVAGFLVVRYFLPLLAPPLLGAGMAFGAGGLLYLAAMSWLSRPGPLTGSLLAAATGFILMGVVRLA